MKGQPMNVYKQLHEMSLPLLEAYETDLTTHDKDWIEVNPGIPFMHYTRATGTHLISFSLAGSYPPPGTRVKYLFGTADREKILQDKLEMQDWFESTVRKPPKLILHCDGRILQQVTISKAREIVEDYVRTIRAEWKLTAKGNQECLTRRGFYLEGNVK
jgi:hypothetical protein